MKSLVHPSLSPLPNLKTPPSAAINKRHRLQSPPPLLSRSNPPPPPPPTPPKENPTPTKSVASRYPLHLLRSEISLPLPTVQTFRWRCTAPGENTSVVGPYLISLKNLDESNTVAFCLHGSAASDAARTALSDYLNLDISLAEMWRRFTEADPRFAEVVLGFDGGARVLRQDPVECLFQFLCSSNNNIGRIERMVGVLSSFGDGRGVWCVESAR